MENRDYFLSNMLVLWLQNIDAHIFPFHIPLLFNYKFWNQHGSVISNTNENQLKVHVILPLNNTTSKKGRKRSCVCKRFLSYLWFAVEKNKNNWKLGKSHISWFSWFSVIIRVKYRVLHFSFETYILRESWMLSNIRLFNTSPYWLLSCTLIYPGSKKVFIAGTFVHYNSKKLLGKL